MTEMLPNELIRVTRPKSPMQPPAPPIHHTVRPNQPVPEIEAVPLVTQGSVEKENSTPVMTVDLDGNQSSIRFDDTDQKIMMKELDLNTTQ